MGERVRFQLWQDGIEVAAVDATDFETATREILHYAMLYSKDGPVIIIGDRTDEIFRAIAPLATGRDA